MSLEKRKKSDLESKRKGFLVIGLSVACAITLTAFEWVTRYDVAGLGDGISVDLSMEEEALEPFRKEVKRKPAVKNPDKVVIVQELTKTEPEVKPEPIEPKKEDDFNFFVDLDSLDQEGGEPEIIEPVVFAEVMPEFPGGEQALFEWIEEHIRYPQICEETGVSGMATARFVVDSQGNVTSIMAISRQHKAFEKEAKRLLKIMPDWKPGSQRGRPVPVYFSFPIRFTLN